MFYQLCKGLSEERKEELFLGESEHYKMLTSGKCVDVDGVDDKDEFELLDCALDTIGLSETEKVRKVNSIFI